MASSQRGSEGVPKLVILGDFQGVTWVKRGQINLKIRMTSFMNSPLRSNTDEFIMDKDCLKEVEGCFLFQAS